MTLEFREVSPGVFRLVHVLKRRAVQLGPETISFIRPGCWVALDGKTEAPAAFTRGGQAIQHLIEVCRLAPQGGHVAWRIVRADGTTQGHGGGYMVPEKACK